MIQEVFSPSKGGLKLFIAIVHKKVKPFVNGIFQWACNCKTAKIYEAVTRQQRYKLQDRGRRLYSSGQGTACAAISYSRAR